MSWLLCNALRAGEQDYPRYPNTYLFDAFRARMPLPALFSVEFSLCQMCLGTFGQRQTVWGCQQWNRTVFPSLTPSHCRSAETPWISWMPAGFGDVIISTCETLRGENTQSSQRWCCRIWCCHVIVELTHTERSSSRAGDACLRLMETTELLLSHAWWICQQYMMPDIMHHFTHTHTKVLSN